MDFFSNIPKDPVILLSFINTKLRDEYASLEELCKGLCISRESVETPLNSIQYSYNASLNQFTA